MARRMSRITSRGNRVIANVRSGVSDTFNDVLGMWCKGMGGIGSKVCRVRSDARALVTEARMRWGSPLTRTTCSPRARDTSRLLVGSGSGLHGSRAGNGWGSAVAASTTCFKRATAAEPSATQWWSLTTTAIRSAARPSTTRMAHSGRSRGRGVPANWPTARAKAWSSPGGSTRVWLRCRERSKSGSSTHTGWPSPSGTGTTRRRNGGSRTNSWPSTSVMLVQENPPSSPDMSDTATLMVCMCVVGVSE